MVKHAETPHRVSVCSLRFLGTLLTSAQSPFAARYILRVYESHISTLHKYPWFAHEHVKMTERRLLYDVTLSIMRALVGFLRRVGTHQIDTTKPTAATLQELAVAALTCPGFSEEQKASMVACMQQGGFHDLTTSRGMNVTFGGNTAIAAKWPFKVLARDPKASDQMVDVSKMSTLRKHYLLTLL